MTTETVPRIYIPKFDEATHTYTDEAGRPLDGVTEVLRGVGLIDIEWVTEKALSRGRAVHHAAHLIDTVGLDWETLHPDLHGYVKAWERAKAETGMEVLDSEQRRYHPALSFAGTRDRRVRWNGRIFKLDLKTTSQIGARAPEWTRLQLSAYDLLDPGPALRPDGRASIALYPDGTYRPEVYRDFGDATVFLSFLTTYRWLRQFGRI